MKIKKIIALSVIVLGVSICVNAQEYENKPADILLIGGIALHPSQTSGYLMVGKMKNLGGYIKIKSNLNFNTKSYINAKSTEKYFTGTDQTGRFAATVGLLQNMNKYIVFYVGLGYGDRWVNWKTNDGSVYKIIDISPKGLELETGMILKFGKINFSGGISSTSFSFVEANMGIGIMF